VLVQESFANDEEAAAHAAANEAAKTKETQRELLKVHKDAYKHEDLL